MPIVPIHVVANLLWNKLPDKMVLLSDFDSVTPQEATQSHSHKLRDNLHELSNPIFWEKK